MKTVIQLAAVAFAAGVTFTAGQDVWWAVTGLVGMCRG